MRPLKPPPPRRHWPRTTPWRFPSLLAQSRQDFRRGYHAVGVAVARELPILAPRLASAKELARLDEAIAVADHRAVVGWLVRNAKVIMRRVPRERRYASFMDGIATGLVSISGSQLPSA